MGLLKTKQISMILHFNQYHPLHGLAEKRLQDLKDKMSGGSSLALEINIHNAVMWKKIAKKYGYKLVTSVG